MKPPDTRSVMDIGPARFLGPHLGGWSRRLFDEGSLKRFRAPARTAFYRYVNPIPYRFERIRSHGLGYRSGARIAFVPESPLSSSAMHKICEISGHHIQNHINESVDLAMYRHDTTFGDDIRHLIQEFPMIHFANQGCRNISKKRLDTVHHEVFGYGVSVEPSIFTGVGLKKSNRNAQGDGNLLQFPISNVDPDMVYQRVIDNIYGEGLVQDTRVPIFKDQIPFVYVQYRSIADRFTGSNSLATIEETEQIFSPGEQALIIALCKTMGLDYGELDVLRDRGDSRLYVVDLNNIPSGPVHGLTKEDHWVALKRMAVTFQDVFLPARLSTREQKQ